MVIKKMVHLRTKILPLLILATLLGPVSVFVKASPVSAAAVRCFAATETAHADEKNCNDPNMMRSLLEHTGATSLSELNDKCFAISIGWAEVPCEDVAGYNEARCIKEDTEAGRYVEVECSEAGVNHDFESRTCYSISESGTVREHGCLDEAYTSLIAGTYSGGKYSKVSLEADCNTTGTLTTSNCAILGYLVTFTRVLSGVVGVVIAIMIVWGGIKYTMSKDNPQETAEAKTIIRNAVIALVFYIFTFAFLQWLIPGGVL